MSGASPQQALSIEPLQLRVLPRCNACETSLGTSASLGDGSDVSARVFFMPSKMRIDTVVRQEDSHVAED
jgi:hypothetical protein